MGGGQRLPCTCGPNYLYRKDVASVTVWRIKCHVIISYPVIQLKKKNSLRGGSSAPGRWQKKEPIAGATCDDDLMSELRPCQGH